MEILFYLAIPIIVALIAKRVLRATITWKEMGIQMGVSIVIVAIVYSLGVLSMTRDTEIWNGEIVSKARVHDHYERAYDCFCTETCSGSGSNRSCYETCQTCYEDRYTVDWSAKTTLGRTITFQHLDRGSKSVYSEPDPTTYTKCYKGEPVSLENNYTNYVKAVPSSIFHLNAQNDFVGKIPQYPRVYNFYQLNRVINIDSKVPPEIIQKMDSDLDIILKRLGAAKQANIIVILTEIDDPSYRHAIENVWLGGKKNDIVIMVGLDGNTITWVDVMTWAMNKGNELFHVTLRDRVRNLKDITNENFVPLVDQTVTKLYDRPEMKDFEYLKDDIQPPTWVIILTLIVAVGLSVGLTYFFHRENVA